jgi:serine/threonine-protein kinase RsbT
VNGRKIVGGEALVSITSDRDIVTARQTGRSLASELGLSSTEATLLATAISEVARNILEYAGEGEVLLANVDLDGRKGISVIARDSGPGIEDLEHVLQSEQSSSKRPGMGLAGARRLMDEFEIVSEAGKGTTVTMMKWKGDVGR